MQGYVTVGCCMSGSAFVGTQGAPGLYPANFAAKPGAPADRSSPPGMFAPVNGYIAK